MAESEKPKTRKQMIDEAREDGLRARVEGKSREVPERFLPDYPVRGRAKAWLEGWDAALPPVRVQDPQVRYAEPEVIARGVPKRVTDPVFWPVNDPLPETYSRRLAIPPQPCGFRDCRAIVLDGGAQAVVLKAMANGTAYLHCRGCRRNFKRRLA